MAGCAALYVDLDNTLLGREAACSTTARGSRRCSARARSRRVTAPGWRSSSCPGGGGRRSPRTRVCSGPLVHLRGGRRRGGRRRGGVVDRRSCPTRGHGLRADRGTGAPELLLERYAGLEYHDPWHQDREVTHLFRGAIDARDADALLEEHGHEHLRLVDNGAIDRGCPAWRAPTTSSRGGVEGARRRAAHARPRLRARGGDRGRRLARGPQRRGGGRGVLARRQRARPRPALSPATLPRNARVAEAPNGAGVYEAVITELAERR